MVYYDNEARELLLQGIDKLANAVKVTLGPKGRNVIISDVGDIHITKDGVTVAKSVLLPDHREMIGVNLFKQAAIATCNEVGDGTSTSTVLAQALLHEGFKLLDKGFDAVQITEKFEEFSKELIDKLQENSKPITTEQELLDVATLSANGDKELGGIIVEAFNKVNFQGLINVVLSESNKTYVTHSEGVELPDTGIASPFLYTNKVRQQTEFSNTYVLTYSGKLESYKPISQYVNVCISNKAPLVIMAHDFSSEVIMQTVQNMNNGVRICLVRTPLYLGDKDEVLKDINVLINARKEDTCSIGKAIKVIIREYTTSIISDASKEAITERVNYLRACAEHISQIQQKEKMLERAALLNGGVAIINVGGKSATDAGERKDRVDDAINAVRAAYKGGLSLGAGRSMVPNHYFKCTIESAFYKALKSPRITLLKNAGIASPDATKEYNINSRELGEELKVYDPTLVIISSLRNAVHVANTILLTNCICDGM